MCQAKSQYFEATKIDNTSKRRYKQGKGSYILSRNIQLTGGGGEWHGSVFIALRSLVLLRASVTPRFMWL